jgi:hypothetical protein
MIRKYGHTSIDSVESTSYTGRPSIAFDSNSNLHFVGGDSTNLDGVGTDQDIFYKNEVLLLLHGGVFKSFPILLFTLIFLH